MKKIFLLILIAVSLNGLAQYPINTSAGNASTLQYQNGSYGGMIGYVFRGTYSDTTAANLSFIKNVPGQVIRIGDSLWIRSNDISRWWNIGRGGSSGGQRFGVSGEDATPAQARTVDFTSTYDFTLNHVRFGTLIADSSSGSVGYGSLQFIRLRNQTFAGTFRRSVGAAGNYVAFFHSDWNAGNVYSEVAASPNGNAAILNYYRAYGDSLVIKLDNATGNNPVLKAWGLTAGAGTKALRYNPSTGLVTYADTTAGGGRRFKLRKCRFDFYRRQISRTRR